MKLKDSLFVLVCITIASHHSASANDDDPLASAIESKNVDSYPVLEKSANDVTRNFSKLVRIGEILDLFSINRIGALWTVIEPQLSAGCSNDMMVYFRGLENEKLWALKSKCQAKNAAIINCQSGSRLGCWEICSNS
jgi:hypothetical protein